MSRFNVTNKELEVLEILWEHEEGLTAKQIVETDPDLILSTVQSVLNKLKKRGLVTVGEIVYSGTVLTRSYQATVTREKFILDYYQKVSVSKLLASFLESGNSQNLDKEISEIEKLLQEKRKDPQ